MILVTGSEGFIGSHLVRSLRRSGKTVITYDIKKDGLSFDSAISPSTLEKIKYCFHLGAITDTTLNDVNIVYNRNFIDSVKLFERMIQYKIPVAFASTAGIYEQESVLYHREINPKSVYAMSKYTTEQWINNNRDRFEDVMIFRLFNVYSINEDMKPLHTRSFVNRFLNSAMIDGEITLFEESDKIYRDTIHVIDVVNSLIKWMESYEHYKKHVGRKNTQYLDLGTGNPVNLFKLAKKLAIKYDAFIKFKEMPSHLKYQYQYYTKAVPHDMFLRNHNLFDDSNKMVDVMDYAINHLQYEEQFNKENDF